MFTWSHLISCTVSWEWSKSLWNCDLQCCSNLTNFKEWWKIVGAIKKLQPTIIAIFDYVLLFHKFYVSNNFYPLLIKKCLKEVLQNPGNPGHLPLVQLYIISSKLKKTTIEANSGDFLLWLRYPSYALAIWSHAHICLASALKRPEIIPA